MSRKYIDRNQASRSSLSRSTSPSLLPSLYPRRVDDFTLSVKRHISRTQQVNPQRNPSHSIRYYLENQLSTSPQRQQPSLTNVLSARRNSTNNAINESYRLSVPVHFKEQAASELYSERVAQNLKHYGKGMLRWRHMNSLSVSGKQEQLLDLHYRLKKQRENQIIRKEEEAGRRRLKELLERYESI